MKPVSNNNVPQRPQVESEPTAGAPQIAGRSVTAASPQTRRDRPTPSDSPMEKVPSALLEKMSTFLTPTDLGKLAETSKINNTGINNLPAFTSAAAADLRLARVAVLEAKRIVQGTRLALCLATSEARHLENRANAIQASTRWYQPAPVAKMQDCWEAMRDALEATHKIREELQELMCEESFFWAQQRRCQTAFQAVVTSPAGLHPSRINPSLPQRRGQSGNVK